jgi:Golgi phosphoprotein 3 (GPP34)
MSSLPEDLVILAVGAEPRGGPGNGKLPGRLRYGMRGAVLVALALAGRVEVADGQVTVRDPAPLGDPDLDEALAGLVHAGGIADLVYPGRENASLRTRVAGLAGQDLAMTVPGTRSGTSSSDDPFWPAAEAAVHSAVHHSAHAAVSAATATSHHSGGSSSAGGSSHAHHH